MLGVRAGADQPAHLPGPLAWTIPAVVGGAVLLLLVRVLVGIGRLRRDPGRAGEALLLIGIAVTLGVVWYGGYVRVPRYLLPLVPLLALVLARAAQLTWRVTRIGTVVWVAAYLLAVGLDLAPDITALNPAAQARYRREREADARLFALLRAKDLRKAYAFEYWLAPRLTFDAGMEIIVAEPFNDRHPPHTQLVDRSSRPAYVVLAGVETFRAWLEATRITSREEAVGEYRVFYDFSPPPDDRPLPRTGFTVRASTGRGDPANLVDARLETGWSSIHGDEGPRLGRGRLRRRASGERAHARERPRRSPAARVARDGRESRAPRRGPWPRSRRRASRRAGTTGRSGSRRAGR